MPKAPPGKHWKEKVELGTYVSPAKGSAVWKQRYEELYEALTKTGLLKQGQMPWVDVRYASNAFFTSRFTGRYLWLKLVALAKTKFLKLHMHDNLAEGFFGIVKIEVPKASIKTFNESPMQSREIFFEENPTPLSGEGAAAEQQRKKMAVKDRKTLEKCWRTFGLMEVRQPDGSLEFTFDKGVAESINKQNANGRKKAAEKVEEEEEEAAALGTSSSSSETAEKEEAAEAGTESAIVPAAKAGGAGAVFEALDMLASVSTKD